MSCSETQYFSTLFTCSLSERDVSIAWEPTFTPLPEAMQEQINFYWLSLAKDFIYNGRLARLEKWSLSSSACRLELRPSDYRTLLYSNAHTKQIQESWGSHFLSRALGISAILVCADNTLVLMKRSHRVGEFPGCFDVFGGHIDCPKNGDVPNVFVSMAQELEEEVGLYRSEIDIKLIGLIEARPHQKPELVFVANTLLAKEHILARACEARDHNEFTQVHTLKNEAQHIQQFLKKHQREFSPSAFGSFCVYMRTCLSDVRISRGNKKRE